MAEDHSVPSRSFCEALYGGNSGKATTLGATLVPICSAAHQGYGRLSDAKDAINGLKEVAFLNPTLRPYVGPINDIFYWIIRIYRLLYIPVDWLTGLWGGHIGDAWKDVMFAGIGFLVFAILAFLHHQNLRAHREVSKDLDEKYKDARGSRDSLDKVLEFFTDYHKGAEFLGAKQYVDASQKVVEGQRDRALRNAGAFAAVALFIFFGVFSRWNGIFPDAAAHALDTDEELHFANIQAANDWYKERHTRDLAVIHKLLAANREVEGTDMVFFAYDKSSLDKPARDKIAAIAKTAAARHIYRFTIFGYTDTVGSEDYNKPLSRDRADAVRIKLAAAMKDLGVVPEIDIKSMSFSNPLRDGGPDLPDSRNRRAVIVLEK